MLLFSKTVQPCYLNLSSVSLWKVRVTTHIIVSKVLGLEPKPVIVLSRQAGKQNVRSQKLQRICTKLVLLDLFKLGTTNQAWLNHRQFSVQSKLICLSYLCVNGVNYHIKHI